MCVRACVGGHRVSIPEYRKNYIPYPGVSMYLIIITEEEEKEKKRSSALLETVVTKITP